jgi:ATP-binding protein involved in chromosome partitioning
MRHDIFGSGGGERLAAELNIPLLGQVPLQPGLVDAADQGRPIVIDAPRSTAAVMLGEIAERIDAAARALAASPTILE